MAKEEEELEENGELDFFLTFSFGRVSFGKLENELLLINVFFGLSDVVVDDDDNDDDDNDDEEEDIYCF